MLGSIHLVLLLILNTVLAIQSTNPILTVLHVIYVSAIAYTLIDKVNKLR